MSLDSKQTNMNETYVRTLNNGRTVTITPSIQNNLQSVSCPELDKCGSLSTAISYPRKQSAPVAREMDHLSLSNSFTSLLSVQSCPEALPQSRPKLIKYKKHERAILPDKLLFYFKRKQKPPQLRVNSVELEPNSSSPKHPSELNLSLPNVTVMKKPNRSRMPSIDLAPFSRPLKASKGRKLSCDFNAPMERQSHKSFLFSLGKVFSSAGRRGSKPSSWEGGYMSEDSADSAGYFPISYTGDGRRRGVVDLESIDGRSGKLTKYSKLGKSMELLPTSSTMDSEVGPFRRENGDINGEMCSVQPLHALLENPEIETRWYFKYFLGKVHYNYLCYDNAKSPVFLSVVLSDAAASTYRCILWKKTGNKRLCIESGTSGKTPSPRSILEKFSGSKYERSIKEISVASIQKDLLTLEEQEGSVNFKFGVLYAKAGQKTDNEMFSNEHGSERFQKFLELLGDEVGLEGWQQFRGGLDNKNNSTGMSSVYTVFEGHEIMFHVSTLLPYSSENEQQLERKRHIGNDIVVIIYVDYDTTPEEAIQTAMTFNPKYMRSHFNHIFALVTYDGVSDTYRLSVCSAESVPMFGPPLPCYGEFADHIEFRDFLLAKLINGEKAAYCTPTFAEKRERTLDLLLKSVEQKCAHEYRRTVSSPSLHHNPQSPLAPCNKKLFEREQSFADFGQRLKVEKIIRGHHPTSQRTTVATKKDPWHTECIVKCFPYQITYGDVCDDGTLIVTTQNDGTYFIFRDGSYSLIIDKSVPIAQLVVAHRHQILLFRTGYSKEHNYLYTIPLKEFYTDKITIGLRSSLSPYLVPYTKGCHLFCTAPLDGQFLRLAVAVKAKVIMMAYKYPATLTVNGSPLTPLRSPNPMDMFIKHREMTLSDVPAHMTLPDERPNKLIVSYCKQTSVELIDEVLGGVQRIPHLDNTKCKLTNLTGTCTSGRSELLIGYNLTCQLVTINDSSAYNSVEIVWNSEPRNLVCMPPYVLAFTTSTIEIRMASNGSLMQTIHTPDLRLISMKEDIYFSSSSSMVQNHPISKTHSSSMTNLPAKFPKNIDKKDFLTSGTYDTKDMTYVYKISFEDMTGRRESMPESIRASVSDESMLTRYSITEEDRETVSPTDLDYVHPITEDDEQGLLDSFNRDSTSIQDDDDGADYDHLEDGPIILNSLQGYQHTTPTHAPFSLHDSEPDYDHIAPLEMRPPRNKEHAFHQQIVSGQKPDNHHRNGYLKSDNRSPGQNRSGVVCGVNPEVVSLHSASPDSGVHDDFASTVNGYSGRVAVTQTVCNNRTNKRHHS